MSLEQISYYSNVLAVTVIILCWLVFTGKLLNHRGNSTAQHQSREPLSWIGLVLQLISYPISWSVWRTPLFSPFAGEQYAMNIALQFMASIISIGSVWLAVSAFRELGKQWSLEARVLEGHDLVTTGVYSIVRHPIYSAMLGTLIAIGLSISHWLALSVSVVVFLAGTKIRIHLEEKLLAQAFGKQFAEWRSRVPGLIPSPKRLFRQ